MEKNTETRNQEDSSRRERWEGGYDDLEPHGKTRDSDKYKNEDRSKSKRREDEDIRGRDRERSKNVDASKEREKEKDISNRDKKREDPSDQERKRSKDKRREKDHDKYREKEYEKSKGHKDGGKERDLEKEGDEEFENENGRDKDRGKEKSRDKDREREKERDRGRDRGHEKDRHKHKHRDTERENDKEKYRDASAKDKSRERERGTDQDKERSRERGSQSQKLRDEAHDVEMKSEEEDTLKSQGEASNISKNDEDVVVSNKQERLKHNLDGAQTSLEIEQRISKMKEERLKKKSEGTSEILSWVNRSRKLPEKRNSEKEKALMFSRNFEEQDDLNQMENEDGIASQHSNHDLSGVKVLHGIEKVIEGGAVVLTLKDQSILADGDINEELDMLENVEIGEQKRRDDAYKAAKKKTGTFEDKFNEDPGAERKILPQYDDSVADEGVTLNASGQFTGDAAKKLEELRKRIQGASSMTRNSEDLNSSGKLSSDYYTVDEMLQFKKPRKKKSIRKKEKLDIEALEAEAVSAGLGSGDLGSRNDAKRKAVKEEQERSEAEMRSSAYKTAYAKADEASKALRMEQTLTIKTEEDDELLFGDDDEDLRRSLERARKLALKKQEETVVSGPQAIVASLTSSAAQISNADDMNLNPASGEPEENKVVFTEMEEFVWGLQLDEESHNPDGGDVFMEEDEVPGSTDVEMDDKENGSTELKHGNKDEPVSVDKQEADADETLHETAVGKGLSGALKLLKDRGTLKETIEWGGRNMDKKKSKLVGIYDADAQKEIRIERTDEYGRILTPKEAFRQLSHKFHGKGPGKMKIEKRQREYQEELKRKKMKNDDTPSLSVERMREAQARLKTPYLVLSGNVKPGQTSDPQSGFATVEKNLPGSLTPMLGDRKVEHFLGIKRGDMGPPKPRT